jgi:hypothetical protein
MLIPLLLVALGLVACSDDGTGTSGDGEVIFGSGEVPETVPADFPVPGEAVIGNTLIDEPRGRTEMVLRISAPPDAVAQYYELNLERAGYAVSSSTAADGSFDIEFSKDGLDGSVDISQAAQDVAQAVVQFTES